MRCRLGDGTCAFSAQYAVAFEFVSDLRKTNFGEQGKEVEVMNCTYGMDLLKMSMDHPHLWLCYSRSKLISEQKSLIDLRSFSGG